MSEKQKNEQYLVTARKWRPLKFADVVGQDHVTQTLKNAIKVNRTHHAYLFSGPRGVGKTTTARILARAMNCLDPQDQEPCNKCETCLSVLDGRSIDVIEIDGASNNSVDDVRKLRENSKYPPSFGRYKMYIIDEVHMLTNAAFNALLKTLEEPPPHLMFVFATTESHKVPATILSRCQRFEFRRMNIEDIVKQLKFISGKENIEIDDESLIAIAQKADGSMRDGQSIFDQVVAFCGKSIVYSAMADALRLIDQEFYFRVSLAIREKNIQEIFFIAKEVIDRGYDIGECLGGLLEHFRNVLAIKASNDTSMVDATQSTIQRYDQEANHYSKGDLIRCMNIIANTEQSIRFSAQPRVRFELALVKMASMDSTVEIEKLIDDIKKISEGKVIHASPTNTDSEEKKEEEIDKSPKPKDTSKDTLKDHWDKFIQHNIEENQFLSSLQANNIFKLRFFNGEIICETDSNFHEESLSKKKDILEKLLADYFNGKVSVKTKLTKKEEVHTKLTSEPAQEYSPDKTSENPKSKTINKDLPIKTSNTKQKENSSDDSKHPIDQKVLELFDARESL
jgi:DNA polymerase III subunit gamma/tau